MSTAEHDRSAILDVHKKWWESNHGLRIPMMAECFPSGPNYFMFNLQGHPYFGIDEKIKLWEFYAPQIEVVEIPEIHVMKLEISGDMSWLACEGIFPIREIGAEGVAAESMEVGADVMPFRIRATEVYQRDDGEGNPVWKMWHFHASPSPPDDEPRPAFGDTSTERGLGWTPWGESISLTGS
jgi:hypothetical protein